MTYSLEQLIILQGRILNTQNAGIGFTEQNRVCILTFERLVQDLLNQYWVCLYLFECIYYDHSKYGHEIPQFFVLI